MRGSPTLLQLGGKEMARQIEVTEQDIQHIENKLTKEKGKMPHEEQALLEAILAKAKAERQIQPQGGSWTFTWTYRF